MPLRPPLGSISVEQFLRRYWQRRPLLIRQAVAQPLPELERTRLFELAARDDVESRIVSRSGERFRLAHGPFDALPPPQRKRWTLLVQGVDLHLDSAHALLRRFRFVPDARLDDLMVSWASDGGGVGPHADSYDVFLLQASGRRRWRLAPPARPPQWVPGLPLKILSRFEPVHDWVLEPGDMLYLPPGWGHDGTALNECMTISIGFRAPSRLEFLRWMLAAAADSPGGADPRFADPGRKPTRAPASIPGDLAIQLRQWAQGWRAPRAWIERSIGTFLTEPKPNVWFERPPPLRPHAFARLASQRGLELDRRSRIAYRGRWVHANGEALESTPAQRRWLRRLADWRILTAVQCADAFASPGLADILHDWYAAGWLRWPQR